MLGDHLWIINQTEITTLLTLPQPPSFSIPMGEVVGSDGEKHGSVIGITQPMSSWSVMLARLPAVLLQMHLVSYIFLGRGNTSGTLLVLPTTVTITLQVKEPIWRFYTLLRLRTPVVLSGTGVLSSGWAWGPTGPAIRWMRVRNPYSYIISQWASIRRTGVAFQLPSFDQSQFR